MLQTPQVSNVLAMLASELTRTVDTVNDVAAGSMGDPETPLGAVVRILNNQLQALNQMEGRVDELEGEVAAIAPAMRRGLV